IKRSAKQNNAPCLIHKDTGLIERVLRDELTDEIDEIVIDSEEELASVESSVKNFFPGKEVEVNLFKGKMPLFDVYGLESQIADLQERKVWLDSGAYLVIDQTEALTVIDVNTGKFVGTENLRDTVLKTNLEATAEIARQLRLRAIGGIVVVDFIDMDKESDNLELVSHFREIFKNDRCKARVYGVTDLGLVEITRKRARSDVKSLLTRGCPFCGGLGAVEKEESVAMRIKRFIRKIVLASKSEALLIECYSTIAEYIADSFLPAWEEEFERKIFIRSCPGFSWSKYRLDLQGSLSQVEHRINGIRKKEENSVVYRAPSA
ncbi:MAG: ribonuclease E/G, partial [Synergistes sp.]|nr:ribonuclease E/G [Synergistes sp.]